MNSNKDVGKCYYFKYSKFFRYKNEIDAVMVANDKEGYLCLNTFSPRYEQLKQSQLTKAFEEGILDPFLEEKAKRAYVADTSLDRNTTINVLKYVEEKYNTKFKIFPMTYYSGMMTVENV